MKQRYLAVVIFGGLWLGLGSASAAPKIEFDRLVYDFGTTSMVQAVSGKFTFTNTGDAPLEVRKPSTTCGCTVAGVVPEVVQPGGSGELSFKMTVKNARGRMQKYINVPSNDPETPNVRLTVQVDHKQIFVTKPSYAVVGMVRTGNKTNLTVAVERTDGKPLALTRATSAQAMIRPSIVAGTDAEAVQGAIAIEIEAEGAPRRFAELIKVYTKDSEPAVALTLQVSGQVVGDVALEPQRLIWGIANFDRLPASHLERALTRSLRVVSTKQDTSLELTSVDSSLEGLDVNVVPLEQGKSYMVVAKFDQLPTKSASGIITLKTNLAEHPQLEVPVSVKVLPRR